MMNRSERREDIVREIEELILIHRPDGPNLFSKAPSADEFGGEPRHVPTGARLLRRGLEDAWDVRAIDLAEDHSFIQKRLRFAHKPCVEPGPRYWHFMGSGRQHQFDDAATELSASHANSREGMIFPLPDCSPRRALTAPAEWLCELPVPDLPTLNDLPQSRLCGMQIGHRHAPSIDVRA